MPRFKVEKELKDGWTRNISPNPKIYRMACCDCNLVHDIMFSVVAVKRNHKDGTFTHTKNLDPKKFRVIFRCRRNNRSTSALRRKKK